MDSRARICKPFKEPRNRFSDWRAGTTTIFVVLAHRATKAGRIDSSELIPRLLKHLQIRALLSLARKEETPFRVDGLHLTFQICGIGNPQEIYGASFATMLTPSSLEEKRCDDVRIISDK